MPSGPVTVLAAGKAAAPMAASFVADARCLVTGGLVISTHGRQAVPEPLTFVEASHPVPDASSLSAGRAALDLAAGTDTAGTLVVLLSGGASALMTVPASGLTLGEKQDVTRRLLLGGADIGALNTVRKHLSAIKGGRLAAACRGTLLAWLVSDGVGDDTSVIASGPTVPDSSTYGDALAVLDRFGGRRAFPAGAVALLERGERGEIAETPKPGAPAFRRTTTAVVGSGALSLEGADAAARAIGYRVIRRPAPVVGEARLAARDHLSWIEATLREVAEPVCLLSSGETTVTVRGPGRGGRNQEFILALSPGLAGLGRPVAACSVGTDGIDGPTDAAGARADETTAARAAARGLSLEGALDRNDSWHVFDVLGDLIRTGPTGTNVGDLQIVLAARRLPRRPVAAGV